LIIGVIVLLLVLLGIWAYVSTRPQTAMVEQRDIVLSLSVEGQVVAPPSARADVMPPYRAPVERVYASIGQRVSRGDVLVELSYPSAQAAYEQTRQEVQTAEQALDEARRQQGTAVAEAEKQLSQARARERQARAVASGETPVAPEGTDAAASAATEGSVTIREPAAELAEATAARTAAEQELIHARADREAALTPYQQRLEAARQAFQSAQSGRKIAQVRAPIAGTVLALTALPGQEIGGDRQTPVATIVDLGEVQVHATMSAQEAESVRTGAPVTLTFGDLPGEQFEGRVARITSEPGRPLRGERRVAIITFQNTQGLAKPEMTAAAAITLGQAQDVLAVPNDAVKQDESGRPVVEVLRDGRWQEAVVEPGLSDGRYTAIKSGLNEDETIRVRPSLL